MTQEEKELLLRDLCSRLPYEVKIQYEDKIFTIDYISAMYEEVKLNTTNRYTIDILEVKPYLFPMSSMTEEQSKEFALLQTDVHTSGFLFACDCINMINWLLKNHFDIYGLIPLGLALDATNLNIY